MKLLKKAFISVLCVAGLSSVFAGSHGHGDKQILAGYYPNWGQYSGYTAEDIRYPLYTHIIYAFYKTDPQANLFNADPTDEENFRAIIDSCHKHNVKLIVSIGGADQSDGFKELSRDAGLRQKFIKNMLKMAKTHEVDGFDIDWEYPCWAKTCWDFPDPNLKPGDEGTDTKHHKALFLEIREAFDKYNKTAKRPLEFSSAVPGSDYWAKWADTEAYMALDFLNVMSYDYMGTWVKRVQPNASTKQTIEVLKYYEGRGIPKEKLVAGFAFYAKTFNKGTGLGSTYEGTGSGQSGIHRWSQLLRQFTLTDYEITFDEDWGAEYAVGNQEVIVFNGIPSTQHQARWVREHKDEGYPGVMFWDMLMDYGVPAKQSLLVALYNELYAPKKVPTDLMKK